MSLDEGDYPENVQIVRLCHNKLTFFWIFYVFGSCSIGRFSEAGLLDWMRFVIFRERSRERSQRTSGPISE